MKIIKGLFVSLLGLSLLSSAPIEDTPYITNEKMEGPFNSEEDVLVTLYFHNVETTDYCFVYYYNVGSAGYVIRERLSLRDAEDGELEMDYTLQFKDRLLPIGMKLEFRITSDSKGTNVLWQKEFFIYPDPGEVNISSNRYAHEDFVRSGYTFHFVDGEVINEERISFQNSIDYLTNSMSNVLTLDEYSFTYNEKIPFGYLAYIYIEDKNNIFPLINKNSEGYIRIPLTMDRYGEDVYFSAKNRMYYNSSNLQLSLFKERSMMSTWSIILPAYIKDDFEEADIYLSIQNFGYTHININIPLRFYLNSEYMGLCQYSSHCIVGGLKA